MFDKKIKKARGRLRKMKKNTTITTALYFQKKKTPLVARIDFRFVCSSCACAWREYEILHTGASAGAVPDFVFLLFLLLIRNVYRCHECARALLFLNCFLFHRTRRFRTVATKRRRCVRVVTDPYTWCIFDRRDGVFLRCPVARVRVY